jgi:hypothetical protein
MLDTLAVMVGYYDFLPSSEFKSEGFRLEELVRFSHEHSLLGYLTNGYYTGT